MIRALLFILTITFLLACLLWDDAPEPEQRPYDKVAGGPAYP